MKSLKNIGNFLKNEWVSVMCITCIVLATAAAIFAISILMNYRVILQHY